MPETTTNTSQSGFWTKHRKFLKETVLLALIYPAVLGTVLFLVFQMMITPAVVMLADIVGTKVSADITSATFQWLKIWFVLTTVVFYHCDYFYITYTRTFSLFFFLADISFLVALYVTFVAINPSSLEPPSAPLISGAYLMFFVAYFAWDLYEFCHTRVPQEKRYYIAVLLWEVASASALAFHLYGRSGNPKTLLAIVSISTLFFIPITYYKARFRDVIA